MNFLYFDSYGDYGFNCFIYLDNPRATVGYRIYGKWLHRAIANVYALSINRRDLHERTMSYFKEDIYNDKRTPLLKIDEWLYFMNEEDI